MKKIMLTGLISVLILSGVGLAEQSKEQKEGAPMQGMMQEMMKGEKTGEGGMGGMMRMMKMMEQCGAMMEQCCGTIGRGRTKESQNK